MKSFAIHQSLSIAVSEVADGNMDFRFSEQHVVAHHRSAFLAKCGIDVRSCVAMSVLHTDEIHIVDVSDVGNGMLDIESALTVDALITREKNRGLFLLTADCMPCVLFDPVHDVLALIHLGWRGVALRLTEKVLKRMSELYGTHAGDVLVWVGPHIAKDSYVVALPEQQRDPMWDGYIVPTEGGSTVDIYGCLKAQLIASAVQASSVHTSGIDTATSENFFSYYRMKRTGEQEGRFATVVSMR